MDRPYCLQELKDLESELHEKYRLSNVFAQHYPCNHKYRVKKGGRKEQFILDSYNQHHTNTEGQLDDQTCSVCFKLRTSFENTKDSEISEKSTHGHNKINLELIENIKNNDNGENEITIHFLKEKMSFYKWLFQHEY
jgi:hypothetical protein